jgi:PPOX class probable F420-dependent enzyme
MDEKTAHEFLAAHSRGILVTLRKDGRPQSSNIVYAWSDGVARISVTADRAKAVNLRRDPRGLLHVVGDSFWQYVSASGTAELSDLTTEPGDAVGQELLELYNSVSPDPHPDPDEYFEAMVNDRRLVVRFRPDSFTGMV